MFIRPFYLTKSMEKEEGEGEEETKEEEEEEANLSRDINKPFFLIMEYFTATKFDLKIV